MRRTKASLIDPIFREHPEFPRLLAGAHRRRVTPMGAPALVRHIAFWNPSRAEPENATDEGPAPEGAGPFRHARDPSGIARRAKADETIRKLYRSLWKGRSRRGEQIVTPPETNSEIRHDGRRLIVLFSGAMTEKGTAADLPAGAGVRADSYRAIKIRFLWRGINTSLNFELHTEFLALTMIVDASPHRTDEEIEKGKAKYGKPFEELLRCLDALSSPELPEEQCEGYHNYLYHEVWHRFGKEVLLALQDDSSLSEKKFVDFRGLVLGARDPKGAGISRPFSRPPSEKTTGKETFTPLDLNRFDSLWKFIICSLPPETEYTLSKFIGGRALYATALGSQSDALSGGVAKPLYYMIYESTQSPWQLGRLIYRVHRAGTARIAATMQFDELRKANETLSNIEEELEKRIPLLLKSEPGDEDKNIEFRDSLSLLYRDVEKRIGKLSEKIDGTLEARIERSRYYVKQFFTVTKALRIRRFSGFQQYDEFVIQRVGPVFEYIDSLGRKYERVQSDRSLLLSRIQTLDALIQQKQVSEAQRIADIALSCALGPYYVGYIVAHSVADHEFEKWVWRYALVFGLTMFATLLIRGLRPEWKFLRARYVRFMVCLPLAFIITGAIRWIETNQDAMSRLLSWWG